MSSTFTPINDFPIPECFSDFCGTHFEVAMKIRDGINATRFNEVADFMGMSPITLASYLGITYKEVELMACRNVGLTAWQSDRIYFVFCAYKEALDLFQNAPAAKKWLNSNIPALGKLPPLSLLDTSAGLQMVIQAINAIKHGVFL